MEDVKRQIDLLLCCMPEIASKKFLSGETMSKTINANLAGNSIDLGATFSTAGTLFAVGDTLELRTSAGRFELATVVSCGGEFMVIGFEEALFECRRWKEGDPPVQKAAGQTSWLIYGLVNHTRD